jgi:ectoine hydroxylase
MKLTSKQHDAYLKDGFLLIEGLFSADEIGHLRGEIRRLSDRPLDSHLYEGDGQTMRALHGCDQQSEVMGRLVRNRRLLQPVEQMLGERVYLHQFKVSLKAAFEGDVWKWHQDYAFWQHNDGLPESKAITAAVFLNRATDFNSPLWLIPGTRTEPLLPCRAFQRARQLPRGAPEWHENVVADFKYTLADDEVRRLAEKNGLVSATGDAGTVLFFHSSVPHASTWNLSPWDRVAVLISYNAVSNRPPRARERRNEQRPTFLAATNADALTPIDDLGGAV